MKENLAALMRSDLAESSDGTAMLEILRLDLKKKRLFERAYWLI